LESRRGRRGRMIDFIGVSSRSRASVCKGFRHHLKLIFVDEIPDAGFADDRDGMPVEFQKHPRFRKRRDATG